MGSAERCPSKAMGLCEVQECCYASKAETLYPNVLPYRERQQLYWLKNDPVKITEDLDLLLKRINKNNDIKYFRFNEAGDFFSQKCVEKLSIISEFLLKEHSITTYGYTARADLNFKDAHFLVKGSGSAEGNNGVTTVVEAKKIIYYHKRLKNKETWAVCPMNCRVCNICKKKENINVIFLKH